MSFFCVIVVLLDVVCIIDFYMCLIKVSKSFWCDKYMFRFLFVLFLVILKGRIMCLL